MRSEGRSGRDGGARSAVAIGAILCLATAFSHAGEGAAQETGLPAARAPIVCGEPYVVRRGDTLQRIAQRAYGPTASYHVLLAPNAALFARVDPSLIEPGMRIAVPCLTHAGLAAVPSDDAAPSPEGLVATDASARDGEAAAPLAKAAQDAILAPPRFAVASAPAGPPDLPARVAAAALAARGARLDRIEDRAAHLGPLLGQGLYAASLPWLRPDCGADGLEPQSRTLCETFDWSAPLAEIGVAMLTADPPRDGPLCVEAALAPLAPDAARREADAAACVAAVAEGAVARAMVEAGAADAAIADLGLAGRLREDLGAFRLGTLHAVALRGSAEGFAALAALDEGLAALSPAARRGLAP